MEFRPVGRRSVVQDVADQLRDAVVAAVSRSEQLPTETELSSALMVSRPTLREALRILETEGLVQRDHRTAALRPDTGTSSMSRPLRSALDILTRTERITMAEILDLRLTVEGRAAERAAEVASEDDIKQLALALDALGEPELTGQEWDERSIAFHIALVKASHNEAFLLVTVAAREAAADILERAIRSSTAKPSGPAVPMSSSGPLDAKWLTSQYELYREIFHAIRDGRGGEARAGVHRWAKDFESFFELEEPPTNPTGPRRGRGARRHR